MGLGWSCHKGSVSVPCQTEIKYCVQHQREPEMGQARQPVTVTVNQLNPPPPPQTQPPPPDWGGSRHVRPNCPKLN